MPRLGALWIEPLLIASVSHPSFSRPLNKLIVLPGAIFKKFFFNSAHE